MVSVNTNYGAMVALQNLSRTQSELSTVQDRINTGLKVASARDNGAVYSIAQDQRQRLSARQVLSDAIDRATATIDVGLSAAQSVQNVLLQMKDKAVAASAPGLSAVQIAAYNVDFTALRDSIDPLVNAAQMNGQNLVSDSAQSYSVKINDLSLGTVITITAQGLTTASLGINALSFSTAGEASTAVSTVAGVISSINTAMASLGSRGKALDLIKEFNGKLTDNIEKGLGILVDADLAKESSKLQALQVKQQLGAQALSIANQAPQVILSLFR
jgi:flagellin